MTEQELRELLRSAPIDLDPNSQQRAWHVVRSAYQRRSTPRRRRSGRRFVLAVASIAIAALLALGAVTGPRHAVAHWIRDAFGLNAHPHTVRGLNRLPSAGQLLVETAHGAWLVHPDGTRHRLGTYTGAAWSPHSRYVLAWRGATLAALNLAGIPQWERTAPEVISAARWSPDGYRIAFLAGAALHVVTADSSAEHIVSNASAPVAPAWQPQTGTMHRLTFVTSAGAIEQIDADTEARIWSAHPRQPARRLLWSPSGDLLLVLGAHALSEYTSAGRPITRVTPGDATIESAAFTSARQFALVLRPPAGRPDTIELLSTGRSPRATVLYTGLERLSDLNASPNRKWLLAASPSADEWLFIHIRSPARLLAIADITTAFQPRTGTPTFPQLAGWQR